MSQTQQFTETILGYASQFPHILSDFIPAYVNTMLSPDNTVYLSTYETCKGNIIKANSQLFMTTNSIQQAIDSLQANITSLNTNIEAEKTKNTSLTAQLQQILDSDNGASILISETTEIYKTQYVTNITMIIGICVLFILLFFIYRRRGAPNM
jgi:hypothetical protein